MRLRATRLTGIAHAARLADTAWTPAQLGASLALWLDADDASTITLNGSTVSQWNDKSGNARHFSQGVAANQPAYSTNAVNGKNVINFVSTDSLTRASIPFNDLGNNSIYIVGNRTGNAGSFNVALILSRATRRTRAVLFNYSGVNAGRWGAYTNGDTPSPTGGVSTAYQICEVIADQTTNSYLFYQNGTSQGSNGVVDVNTVFSNSNCFIGNDQANSWLLGNVAEIVFCDEKNSDADRQKIEGYLAWKWGLTHKLPNDHPYKWDGSVFGYVNQNGFDADAKTYITAVETADTIDLETDVRVAINDFVSGCKADGIWTAIKASAILAGARTLSGALVPLVGTAPTNFNFVSGDYSRTTGLIGNGTTKYLNSNRNNNADPQNNRHIAAYINLQSTSAQLFAGGRSAGVGTGATAIGFDGANPLFRSIPDTNTQQASGAMSVGSPTLIGASRAASSSYTARVSGSSASISSTSGTPNDIVLFVFGQNNQGTIGTLSNARIAFYSIGESLDLALLGARVTTLINAYGAIP